MTLYLYMRRSMRKQPRFTAKRHGATPASISWLSSTIVKKTPESKDVHIVLDNLSARKHRLNQVELWFAKFQRDAIAHGVFTSVTDRLTQIDQVHCASVKTAGPFRWTHRIPPAASE